MCGRFSLYFFPDAEREFGRRFGIPFPTWDYPASYNIAPFTDIPVVRAEDSGAPKVEKMFWGLIPPFARAFKPSPQYKMSNTRAESFDKAHDFRKELLLTCRCVVPANNYFEWKKVGGKSIPFKIERQDAPIMGLGAIYSVWRDREGRPHYSCSIITVPANRALAPLHPRMPFILYGDTEKLWLDPEITDGRVLRDAMTPYPDDGLQVYPVSTRVNSTRNNDPDLVVPLPNAEQGRQFELFGG